MEVALQAQRPMSCAGNVVAPGGNLRIKPFLGFFPNAQSSQFTSIPRNYAAVASVSFRITASADFSRKPRKATPRSKGRASKGFVPKSQAGTPPQRRDQKNIGRKAGSSTPARNEQPGPTKKTPDMVKVDANETQAVDTSQEEERLKKVMAAKSSQVAGNGSIGIVDNDAVVPPKIKTTSRNGTVNEETDETEKKSSRRIISKTQARERSSFA